MESSAISRREWTPVSRGHTCSPASCDCDSVGGYGGCRARAGEDIELFQIDVNERLGGATAGPTSCCTMELPPRNTWMLRFRPPAAAQTSPLIETRKGVSQWQPAM